VQRLIGDIAAGKQLVIVEKMQALFDRECDVGVAL
jgi:hypothetical protein